MYVVMRNVPCECQSFICRGSSKVGGPHLLALRGRHGRLALRKPQDEPSARLAARASDATSWASCAGAPGHAECAETRVRVSPAQPLRACDPRPPSAGGAAKPSSEVKWWSVEGFPRRPTKFYATGNAAATHTTVPKHAACPGNACPQRTCTRFYATAGQCSSQPAPRTASDGELRPPYTSQQL